MPVKCVSDELRDAILFFIDKRNHVYNIPSKHVKRYTLI